MSVREPTTAILSLRNPFLVLALQAGKRELLAKKVRLNVRSSFQPCFRCHYANVNRQRSTREPLSLDRPGRRIAPAHCHHRQARQCGAALRRRLVGDTRNPVFAQRSRHARVYLGRHGGDCRRMQQGTRLVSWEILYSKQAQKDAQKLATAGLKDKALQLLAILKNDPFQNPPPYEKLVGDLAGAHSRRINVQHRLIYQVLSSEKQVKVLRLWSHYE